MLWHWDCTRKDVMWEEQDPHNETPETNKHYLKHTYGKEKQFASPMVPLVITRSPIVLTFSLHIFPDGVKGEQLHQM